MAAQADAPPPLSATVGRFGLNVHHFEYEPEAFPLVAEARVRWVRLAAWWRTMEQKQGQIDFGYLDLSVDAALAHGLKVLIVFASVPAWANGKPPGGIISLNASVPPTDPQFFQTFVAAVVTHFRGKVDAYEIWNEPNVEGFWPKGEYERFIDEILIPGAKAVKAADPAAQTLGPATNNKPSLFEQAVVKACPLLDILSCHLYSAQQTADAFHRNATAHLTIVQARCNKPLWVTEFGVDSWAKGEDVQAQELVKTLDSLRTLPDLHGLQRLFLFEWRDGYWSVSKQKGWGLVGNSVEGFRRKQSFWKVQELALQALHRPGVATSPVPADGATNVPIGMPLSWSAGRDARSHRISLGTEMPLPFLGEQTATTFPAAAAPREHGKTYLWRVDEAGVGGSTTGTLWRFTVEEDPAAVADVIVQVLGSSPFFLATSQGQGCTACSPLRSLVRPGTSVPNAWTVASHTGLAVLLPAGPAGKAVPDQLSITLSGLRQQATYRVFGRFVTAVEQDAQQAAVRMGLDPASMTLCSAGTPGATVVNKSGLWQEREVPIGTAPITNGSLTVLIDTKGAPVAAGWSGLRLQFVPVS